MKQSRSRLRLHELPINKDSFSNDILNVGLPKFKRVTGNWIPNQKTQMQKDRLTYDVKALQDQEKMIVNVTMKLRRVLNHLEVEELQLKSLIRAESYARKESVIGLSKMYSNQTFLGLGCALNQYQFIDFFKAKCSSLEVIVENVGNNEESVEINKESVDNNEESVGNSECRQHTKTISQVIRESMVLPPPLSPN